MRTARRFEAVRLRSYNGRMAQNPPARNRIRKYDPLHETCPVRAALDVIRGRWKPSILHELCRGPRRFNEIQAAIPEISAQALTVQLRELMADEIIDRLVYDDGPVRVAYVMTEFGMSLSDVMDQLEDWGEAYLERRRCADR